MSETKFLTENLKKLFKESGLGLEAIAAKSDVSYHTAFRAISKGAIPTLENACKLAAGFGVSVSDILRDPSLPRPPPANSEIAASLDRNEALLRKMMTETKREASLPTLEEERLLWLFRSDSVFRKSIRDVFEAATARNKEKMPRRLFEG